MIEVEAGKDLEETVSAHHLQRETALLKVHTTTEKKLLPVQRKVCEWSCLLTNSPAESEA